MTSMLLLCGRRGTYDQVARLVLHDARWCRGLWLGRCGAWWHLRSHTFLLHPALVRTSLPRATLSRTLLRHTSLSHTHAVTSLPHDTSFTYKSSTDCSWTHNSFLHTHPFHMQHFGRQLFHTHLRQLLHTQLFHRKHFRIQLFTTIGPSPPQLSRLPSTDSITVCYYWQKLSCGLSGPLILQRRCVPTSQFEKLFWASVWVQVCTWDVGYIWCIFTYASLARP